MRTSSLEQYLRTPVTGTILVLASAIAMFFGLAPAQAALIQPTNPNFGWLLDTNTSSTAAATFGTYDGANTSVSLSSDTPFSYVGDQSYVFSGGTSQVSIADHTDLRPGTGAWTTSLWYKAANATQNAGLLTHNGGGFTFWNEKAGSFIDTGTDSVASKKVSVLLLNGLSNVYENNTVNDVTDGNWHNVVMVRAASGTSVSIYIDGTLAGANVIKTGDFVANLNTAIPWIIGKDGTASLNGKIDEVAMWNTALSSDNAAWLAANSLQSLTAPLPEPASAALLGTAGALLLNRRRRPAM